MERREFSKIEIRPDFKDMQKRWLEYWEEENLISELIARISQRPNFSFVDGPITANNPMGVHHAWGRTLKDVIQRFKAMLGFNQRLQNGFDCHGLWVEVETEKELGLKTKKDIENYGIENFSRKCRDRVMKFAAKIEDQSKNLGQWMDWPNSYFTMSDENIETIWHFLKVCREKGLLFKGSRVMPWCPRCGTSLSQHELMDSYREMVHKALFLKFPIAGESDLHFLVWTTTPWTLTSNVALAVNPNEEYVEVLHQQSRFILAKVMISCLDGEYEVLREFEGTQLEGMEYVGPFDELVAQSGVLHKVVLWEEVGREGTGIVHIAPGCGQEDFELGERYGLPAISPIDQNGVFLEGFEALTGKSVFDTNEEIFDSLSRKGMLYKIHDYEHRYPECWRCHEEIVFRLVDEWFLAVPKVRQLLLDEVEKVEWKPAFGKKLMKDWLAAMEDWCISRKRYWGLPLPFFECKSGHLDVVSSKKELLEKAIDRNEPIVELHRPWIDHVKIRCGECGEEMTRIPEVGDCWLDAGIVPFSTLNYLNDRDYWNEWFPSELVLEMREQVRLWFYSLLVMSCVLEGRAPFKSVVMYSRVVDENGEAMHRSKGNVIWFDDAIEKMGADVMRWVYCSQNPRVDLRFGFSSGKQAARLLSILWNVYRFFMTYASVDKPSIDPTVVPKCDNVLDRWIVSRLNSTLSSVADSLKEYRVDEATKPLEDFILDLANWYVRRSRRRFWKTESDEPKTQGYDVLFHVLLSTSKMLALFTPFLSEEIYQGLLEMAGKSPSKSVHLCGFPASDPNLIDIKLEEEMVIVRKFVEMGLSLRSKMKLKVRQPLARVRAVIDDAEIPGNLRGLLLEELNVKGYDETLEGDCIEEEHGPPSLKIWLDTAVSKELMDEAFVRELVRHVQRMRKEKDLHVEDRICLYVDDKDTYLADILSQWEDYVKRETFSERILIQSREDSVPREIAGRTVFLAIERSPQS